MNTPKPLSRRAFFKTAGAVTVSGALAACLPASTSTPAPRKKTLRLAIQQFAHAAMRPVVDAWTAQTGYPVELIDGPTTGEAMIAQFAPGFAADTSPVDVISDDDASGPAFYRSGWMEPLDDIIPAETWADFPRLFDPQIEVLHAYQGRRYRVPHEFSIGYFWYRKDWFDQRGLHAPQTWEEFVTIGQAFNHDRVSGTIEALTKPGLVFVFLAYLAAQTGGSIFNFDEATAAAFQFAYDLIYKHRILPETAFTLDYTGQNQAYMTDGAAMMRQWPYFFSVARDNTVWYADGKAEIALPPAGPVGSKSWWGGWGFSVPKSAPNKEQALDLLRWITSIDNAPLLAQGQSWFVTPRKSILAALGDTGLVPAMKMYIENNVPTARPFHEKQAQAQTIVDDVGLAFLTRQMSLSAALSQGADRMKALG